MKLCGRGACSGLLAVIVKLLVAVCDGEAESVTFAVKPAVPAKLAVPESTPVVGSMDSPSTNSAVDEMGEIDHVSAPTPLAASNVTLYG